jgi:TonB family protein
MHQMRCLPNLTCAVATLLLAPSPAANAQPIPERPAQTSALIDGYLCDATHYPAAALRKEIQGTVRIGFAAAADGTISDVAVLKSSGDSKEHKLLDLVSKRQVQSCKLSSPTPSLEVRMHTIDLVWKVR